MIRINKKRFLFIRKLKKDLIGFCLLKKKLLIIKFFLLFLAKLKRKNIPDFFRIKIIEQPIFSKKRTKFFKFFILRQQFRMFYSFIKIKKLKKIILKSLKKKDSVNAFIYFLESRLDVLLFRLNLVSSIREARQKILHGNILVNNKIIKKASYNLVENDYLSFKKNFIIILKKKLYFNIKNKNNFLLKFPNYIEYNLNSMLFIFTKINIYDVRFFYKLNFYTILSLINFYRKQLF
jgi:ribosomal protein S4